MKRAIEKGASPPSLDLEITESLVMEDIEANIGKLAEVCALGLQIAIDDFGTGYSSLAYLAKLPVQALKIDRSFVITMLEDANTMNLVSTVISLAHSLKRKVVAEGVDAEGQAKKLRKLGCDEMQGYLFSKPLPVRRHEGAAAEGLTIRCGRFSGTFLAGLWVVIAVGGGGSALARLIDGRIVENYINRAQKDGLCRLFLAAQPLGQVRHRHPQLTRQRLLAAKKAGCHPKCFRR